MRRILAWLALGMVLAPACKDQDNTKIVVAVWSDLAVPSELDSVRIDVAGPTSSGSKTFPLTAGGGTNKLPVQLELVPLDAKDATFTVKATGTGLVTQSARVSFVAGQSLLLKLFLAQSCKPLTCVGDTTCAAGACTQPIAVASLPPYDPSQPLSPPDAGTRSDSGTFTDGGSHEAGTPDLGAIDVAAIDAVIVDLAMERSSDGFVPVGETDGGGERGEAGGFAGLDALVDVNATADLPLDDRSPLDGAFGIDLSPGLDTGSGQDAFSPNADGQTGPDSSSYAQAVQLCYSAGGTLNTQLCCGSAADFRDTCTSGIGACSCSPTSSRAVTICSCPSGGCFKPGVGCVAPGSI